MSRSDRRPRGFTIADLVAVLFISGFAIAAISIMGPSPGSQDRTRAKVDTVQAVAGALHQIEHDLRNTDLGSVYACTINATPTCSIPTTALSTTSAIVIVSAYNNGTGKFVQSLAGKPGWQGADVYWVDPSGTLRFAFDAPTSTLYVRGDVLSVSDAKAAVADALVNGGVQLAGSVEHMSIAVPNIGHQVSFRLKIKTNAGAATNETMFQTDLVTRN
jgi:hypothetical protein